MTRAGFWKTARIAAVRLRLRSRREWWKVVTFSTVFACFFFVCVQAKKVVNENRAHSKSSQVSTDGILPWLQTRKVKSDALLGSRNLEDECSRSFTHMKSITEFANATVQLEGRGRFGNSILGLIRLVLYAETNCCHIFLPGDILSGIPPMAFRNTATCPLPDESNISSHKRCENQEISDMINTQGSPRCAVHILRKWLQINYTHVFGEKCPATGHAAFHVRSGDIVSGTFDAESGSYLPSTDVHEQYWLYPTSFYTAAYKNVKEFSPMEDRRVFVICENMDNPTCEFFSKLADIDQRLDFRTGNSLIDDLKIMLCAREIAASRGTLQVVFSLSQHAEKRHRFTQDNDPGMKNLTLDHVSLPRISPLRMQDDHQSLESEFVYSILDETERNTYRERTYPWKNTAHQRYLIDKKASMSWYLQNRST
jgi:hypothetical protein